MDTIGKRLKWARQRAGISQTAVAVACGWEGHTRVSNYEKEVSEPDSFDALERLAAAVGVSAGWLAFGEAPGEKLSAEERSLLALWRRAGDEARLLAVMALRSTPGTVTDGDDLPITLDLFGSGTRRHADMMATIEGAQAKSRRRKPRKTKAKK